jgi:hypothetical protein
MALQNRFRPREIYALTSDMTPKIGTLTPDQGSQFRKLLLEFADLFAKDITQLGRTDIVTHKIYTEDVPPISSRPYMVPLTEQKFINEEIQKMLDNKLIRESTSPWASPVVLVTKKNGKKRFCVDYRKLNAITKKDSYPLPRIDEMLDSLAGAKYFSTLDLMSGYWQVEMNLSDREKTAFITRYGIYEFNVMPFGLCNAPATFQRLMNYIYQGIAYKYVVVYLDDTNIFSKTFDDHLKHLHEVFTRIRKAGLKLNLEKCNFWMKRLPFLGHIIEEKGISPDPDKIIAVQNITPPKNVTQLRSFLGLAGYYRRFIRNFSSIAQPLNQLLRKDIAYDWKDNCQQAFDELKQRLTTAPILIYPDYYREFILATDASYHGFGATLSQLAKDKKEHPIAYASKSLRKEEVNYAATELECAAVVWAIEHFHKYLGTSHFTLVTDHSALKWMKSSQPKGRIGRWLLKLQPYNFTIIHKPGRVHSNVDALSRLQTQTHPSDNSIT